MWTILNSPADINSIGMIVPMSVVEVGFFRVSIQFIASLLQAYANLLRGNMTKLKKKGRGKGDSSKSKQQLTQ